MKLVDTGIILHKTFDINEKDILWIKTVNDIDVTKRGGWMFVGEWINLRFQENVKVPCPVICCVADENEEKDYYLFLLSEEGAFEHIITARGIGWANTLLPAILEIFGMGGEIKIVDVSLSGEALRNAKWITSLLPETSLTEAVDFALKFTKDAWTKQLGNQNRIQSENNHS